MELAEVPCSRPGRGQVLIRSRASLISAGTERMLVEFSQANLIQKARQQPDKVRQVLDKIRTDGLLPTLEAVFRKLDEPMPLGYCNAGVVVEVGPGVADLAPGDRVVSNGAHAEVVCVPRHLCAKVPDGVPANGLPTASCPMTCHWILWLFAKAGDGVQVSTVLPALQAEITGGDWKPAVTSKNCATVAPGFMAALKVNTTGAPGETPVAPLAGTVERIVVCAPEERRPARNIIMDRSRVVRV